jgi:hypothetical protein
MNRYYYETTEDVRGRWFVFDRKRGHPAVGETKAIKAVAMCFNRDDAERIVDALNLAVEIAIDRQAKRA